MRWEKRVVNYMKAVADFRKCTNGGEKSGKWYESSKYGFSKSAVADFRKSGNLGGISTSTFQKSPMPDFRKSANLGRTCAEHIVTKTLCIIQATNYEMFL